MKRPAINCYPATCLYIISVVLINTLFLWIPLISVGGVTMTPADVAAGSVYIFRDFAQREIKHYVILAMLIAITLSYFLANNIIALASFSAFSVAELLDYAIFTLTKKPLSERLLWSACISVPVDSLIFCQVAGTLSWLDFILMSICKFLGVLTVWYFWKIRRPSQAQEYATE